MKTLAIDTATSALSLAVYDDQKLLANHFIQSKRQHGELLVPAVLELLKQLKWKAQDLEKLIIAVGPGSYTGLRIGTTMAKVWAASHGLELTTVSTLALMAASVMNNFQYQANFETTLFVPIIDARRMTAYTGAYTMQKTGDDSTTFNAQNVVPDQHTPWEEWLEQLASTIAAMQIERIVLLGQEISAFAQMTSEYFPDMDIMTVADWQAMPHTCFAMNVTQTTIEDPNLLLPNYGHATLAEKEWAEKNNRAVASEEENETYIEHFS